MKRIRLTAAAALALAALPATARAQTFWDFVALNGVPVSQGSAPVNVAGPYNVCNGALGCVALSSNTANVNVVFKWNSPDVLVPDEKGVGLCLQTRTVCGGDEVGNVDSPAQGSWLLIDLSGLAPGTAVLSVTIASLGGNGQFESFKFDLCDTPTSGCSSEYTGSGLVSQTIWTIPVTQGSHQWIRFKPDQGDYLVQGITTTVPEPGTMGLLATGLVALAGAGTLRRRKNRK